ncbi:MAG: T9SS type A sorting domain-containing protein, partial [Candidatus Cloacimonetes bacterium]|nr:T9SS type A sorting domain-containing protein [Candidatus Cloacimonadota bacterium]
EIEINGNWYYAPLFDIEGNPRPDPVGSSPDIGAYENPLGEPQVGITQNQLPSTDYQLTNYPNPFNPTTTINYSLKENSKVSLSIYNIKGQKIKTLAHDEFTKGSHSIIWNGRDSNDKRVDSGIYFYKLKAGDYQKVRKMVLLK